MKAKIVNTTVMIMTMVSAQNLESNDLILTGDGDVLQVWDTGITIMLESVSTGNTLEIYKENNVKSSNNYRYTLEDHRQIWQNFAEWKKLKASRLLGSSDEVSGLRNQEQSDSLDVSRGRIRQDKPR